MSLYIGETIKRLLKKRGITQETLANFLNVSYQSVSKWERNESYPDITLIPAIASFFGVTTDTLLGIEMIKQENRKKDYIEKYMLLCNTSRTEEAEQLIKQATAEFPGDHSILSCYLSALVSRNDDEHEKLIEVKSEVYRIYSLIQKHCTDDYIRAKTKSTMCSYIQALSKIENSGTDISEIEPILAQMPVMRNTRDYRAMFLYPHGSEKRNMACAKGFSEMLQLLGEIINRKASDILARDPVAIKAYLDFVNTVMPDGDFGQCYYLVIFNYGYLGVIRHNSGDDEEALECFRRQAELALKYEAMPDITIHTSYLVKGLEFNKKSAFKGGYENIADAIREALLDSYPLSDEFRATDGFKKIIESLGNTKDNS